MVFPYLVVCAGIAVFVGAVIARIVLWAKMPIHMWWELYPVTHEAGKVHYGGSYLEESEGWTKPRDTSIGGGGEASGLLSDSR